MTDEPREDCIDQGRSRKIRVLDTNGSGWQVGAGLRSGADMGTVLNSLTSLAHAHQAVVLSIATAACGHARIASRSKSKKRGDERQAEHGQEQDGEQSTQ